MKIIKTIAAIPAALVGAAGLSLLFAFLTIKIQGRKLIKG